MSVPDALTTHTADFGQALVPLDLQDDAQRRGTRILQNFFAYLTNKNTRQSYADDLRVFMTFMRGVYRERLSPAQMVDCFLFDGDRQSGHTNFAHANAIAECFRQWQLKLDRSSGTINRRLTMLRGLSTAARRLGLITWTLEVRGVRHEARRDNRGPLTATVAKLLRHLATVGSPLATRDCAIIHLLHDLGLRRAEVASLDVSHVNFEQETIAIMGKGRREREVLSLPEPTQQAIHAWLAVRGSAPGGALFLLSTPGRGGGGFRPNSRITGFAIYKQVRDYGRECGFALRPHGFRHTAITSAMVTAAERRIPFEEVMQFSRHKTITMLMRYRDQLHNRQPELADAVADLVGRALVQKGEA
jgi:integrase/recombinase XerC